MLFRVDEHSKAVGLVVGPAPVVCRPIRVSELTGTVRLVVLPVTCRFINNLGSLNRQSSSCSRTRDDRPKAIPPNMTSCLRIASKDACTPPYLQLGFLFTGRGFVVFLI